MYIALRHAFRKYLLAAQFVVEMKISFLKRMEFCIVAWLILYDAYSNKIKQQYEEEFLISKLELLS